MYPDYIQQMLALRDYAAPLAVELCIPSARSLIIRRRESRNTNYLKVEPLPTITTAYPKIEGFDGIGSVQVITGDFEVKGVSRKYMRSQLVGSRIDYVIDGILQDGVVNGGMICDLVTITENTLTWDLVLRQKIGEQKM